jgi:hypothetical protein
MSAHAERQALLRRHREVLAVAVAVTVLAFLLRVRADDRVILAGLPDYPLPATCLSHAWFGVDCPGCGLTRSLVHLAHADGRASWQAHRLGWLMALVVLLQFPYRLLALARGGEPPLGTRLPWLVGHLLIALLLGNWLWKILS